MAQVLIVGLGSPHGDDQVGWQVIQQLTDLPDSVRTVALLEPTSLLDQLEPCARLILVDACQSGSSPGVVHRSGWPFQTRQTSLRSSHGFDLASLLRLAESLGRLPAVVSIFAVEADRCQPGDGLSPAVQRALPALIAELRREVAGGPWAACRRCSHDFS